MGQSLKKRAKRHGLWPETSALRDRESPSKRNLQHDRAEARREARKKVGKAKRGKPWKRRYTRRVVKGEGGHENVFWDRGSR